MALRFFYATCAVALAFSCGVPSALHALGHNLTQTNCKAESEKPFQTQPAFAAFQDDEHLSECWIQGLVSTLAHSPVRLADAPLATEIPPATNNFLRVAVATPSVFLPATWISPRGPPTFG